MAFREVHRVELYELIRRWQGGESQRALARGLGLSRNTVGRYLEGARRLGLTQAGPPPTEAELVALATLGSVVRPRAGPGKAQALLQPFQERIAGWVSQGLQLTRIQELLARQGCGVSYMSLHRCLVRVGLARSRQTTVRMAPTPPGEVAECDFGRLGTLKDAQTGRQRWVWALVVVLAYSRHLFVWPLYGQRLPEVIEGLEAAWRFFGGVAIRLILDNFPAAVAQPDALSPRLTRGFLEYAQHRGFLPDCARVRHPQDKPHVERAVPYVRERFFKGGTFGDLADVREQARRWCLEVAGRRLHGTTRQVPLRVFLDEEQGQLRPLVPEPFEVPAWATVRVHPDHHVSFGSALYSVPATLCPPGATLELRATDLQVRLYHRGTLIKTHPRCPKGGRSTDPNDYPQERATYALRAPERLQRQAALLGPHVRRFAEGLLAGPLPWAKLRQAQKLVRLGERYGAPRLDAACARALEVDLLDVHRVERILVQALESEAAPAAEVDPTAPPPLPARFARPGSAFAQPPQEATAHVG